jgi:hypothetical protein
MLVEMDEFLLRIQTEIDGSEFQLAKTEIKEEAAEASAQWVYRPSYFSDAPSPRPDFESKASAVYHEQSPAGTGDILKGALFGLAATKLKGLVEELLPGFQEEYRKAEAGNS